MIMKHLHATLAAVVCAAQALVPSAVGAQSPDPRCTDPAVVGTALTGGDACQKALDLFHYINPQFGTLMAGGNATLGQGGPLGGPGRFAVTVRVNGSDQVALRLLEDVEFETGAPRRSRVPTESQVGAFPAVDLALGLYRGYPVGSYRVGGVDALMNVFYIPGSVTDMLSEDGSGLTMQFPEGGLKLGVGVRVGLLEEGRYWPGVSVSYLQRGLPTVNLFLVDEPYDDFGNALQADTVSLRDFSVGTGAWRLVAGKRLLRIFNVAVGVGRDSYDTSGQLAYAVTTETRQRSRGSFAFGQNTARTTMFADVSLNLFLFRLVGEVGRVSGGDVRTYNDFDEDPNAARRYFSIGLRAGR
jgi:hypothetical protein